MASATTSDTFPQMGSLGEVHRARAPPPGRPDQPRHGDAGPQRLLRRLPRRARRQPGLRPPRDHRHDRALGLREVHRAAVPQPDERPRDRSARRGRGALPRAGHLREERRPHRRTHHIGMVFQKPNPFPKSIYDNIAYGPRVTMKVDNMDDLVEEALSGAALWDEVKDNLKQSAYGLSGGQQQRLCIARTIATKPDVILMDEPCSALDPIATARVEDLMLSCATSTRSSCDAQHAAGGPRVRPHGVLHRPARRETGNRTGLLVEYDPPRRSSPTPTTSAPRTTSPAASAEPWLAPGFARGGPERPGCPIGGRDPQGVPGHPALDI